MIQRSAEAEVNLAAEVYWILAVLNVIQGMWTPEPSSANAVNAITPKNCGCSPISLLTVHMSARMRVSLHTMSPLQHENTDFPYKTNSVRK